MTDHKLNVEMARICGFKITDTHSDSWPCWVVVGGRHFGWGPVCSWQQTIGYVVPALRHKGCNIEVEFLSSDDNQIAIYLAATGDRLAVVDCVAAIPPARAFCEAALEALGNLEAGNG